MAEQQQAPASTITLYDRDAKPVEVAGADAAALLRSGQYGLPEGSTVPMKAPDGSWEQVDAQTALARSQSYTAQIGSTHDVERAAREKEFGGLGMKALAAGSGVVDSLGLGFGDAGIVKAGEALGYGDQARRFLQDADEFAPMARVGGKAAGFLAPLLVSGGTAAGARGVVGTAARAATAPARALTALAEGAGGFVARGAAEGGAPLLGKFLAPAVSQGLELGVYGAGDAASRMVVRDPQADGEALAATMGQGFLHGAAMGAGLGAGIGVLGAGASFVGGKVAGAADRAATRVGTFVDAGVGKLRALEGQAAGGLPGLLTRGEEVVGQGLDRATGMAEQITGRTAPAATGGGLADKADRLFRTAVDVDKVAVEKTLRSTGANQKLLQEAAEMSPAVQERLVSQIDKYGEKLGTPGQARSFIDQAKAAQLTKREAGAQMGEILDRLDASGAGFDPTIAIRVARKEVLEPMKRIAGAEGEVKKLSKYLDSLESRSSDLSFSEFHAQRSFLDKKIRKYERSGDQFLTESFQNARDILEESFTASADITAKRAGGEAAAAWRAAKEEYRAAVMGEKLTKEGAKRELGNRTMGLSEQLGTVAGLVTGGGGLTGMALGAGGAIISRAVKQGGDQVASAILREMRAGKLLTEAVADVTRRNIGEQTKKFFDGLREPAGKLLEQGKAKGAEVLGRVREGAEKAVAGAKAGAKAVGEAGATVARGTARVAGRTERAGVLAVERKAAEDEFEQRRKAIASYKAAGPARVAQVAEQFRQSGADGPTAQAAAEAAARGADYLAKTLPAVPQKARTLQPELSRDLPSPDEIDDWLRRARVVDDPGVVLKSLGRGQLNPEEIETLREVYPGYYQAIRDEVAAQVHELTMDGIELPHRQEQLLQQLFPDIDTDPASSGDFIAAMLAPPPAQPPGLAPSARRPMRVSHLYDLETRSP